MRAEEKRSKRIYSLCMNIVTAIFLVCAVALVTVGVMEYKNIAVSNVENYKLRTSLSYVATKVRQSDKEGCVELKDVKGTKMLLLYEEIDGTTYETSIYWHDGSLREYYHEKGSEFEPENGFEVVPVSAFSFEQRNDGLLAITATDVDGKTESMFVAINSGAR
ncbi:MAG: DUF4860 domain-containing protein [Lachnospiraceae bacterium]|nr:DUF4860 domain-containing protein [Lachnospiraceae bacterium]